MAMRLLAASIVSLMTVAIAGGAMAQGIGTGQANKQERLALLQLATGQGGNGQTTNRGINLPEQTGQPAGVPPGPPTFVCGRQSPSPPPPSACDSQSPSTAPGFGNPGNEFNVGRAGEEPGPGDWGDTGSFGKGDAQ